MNKNLNTDQMTTLLKTLTIFIDNRDPFTTENVINELKRDGDQFNGFYDDMGRNIVDDLYVEIDDAIDSLILQFFPDFVVEQRRVYLYEPLSERVDEFDEYEVDKEGNRLPNHEEVYDDTEDDLVPGEYYDENGEIDWDRDEAETYRMNDDYGEEETPNYSVNDHVEEHELTIDKNKRINISKKILVKEANWNENESVFVIGKRDGKEAFIIKTTDLNWELSDDEIMYGEYQLKNGVLRISISSILNEVEKGDKVYCKVHFPVIGTDDNVLYVHVYVE